MTPALAPSLPHDTVTTNSPMATTMNVHAVSVINRQPPVSLSISTKNNPSPKNKDKNKTTQHTPAQATNITSTALVATAQLPTASTAALPLNFLVASTPALQKLNGSSSNKDGSKTNTKKKDVPTKKRNGKEQRRQADQEAVAVTDDADNNNRYRQQLLQSSTRNKGKSRKERTPSPSPVLRGRHFDFFVVSVFQNISDLTDYCSCIFLYSCAVRGWIP
jgi:hypothetical protein